MNYLGTGIAVLVGYLLGSISFGIILSKAMHKDDIRKHGSGNAGMTNALRVYGGKTAVLVFAGDFLKGVLSVVLGNLLGGRMGALAAAVAVVIGHLFPVFFGFRGGKGVATAAGTVLALSPVTLAILLVPFGLILLLTRYMSLAAITVGVLYPIVTAVHIFVIGVGTGVVWQIELAVSVIIGLLIVVMHRANIGRLLSGTESKVGGRKK